MNNLSSIVRIQRIAIFLLAVALFAASSRRLSASSFDYNASDWSKSGNGTVSLTPAGNALFFNYVDYTYDSDDTWTLSSTASTTGTIDFYWHNTGFYSFFYAMGSLEEYYYDSTGNEHTTTLWSVSELDDSGDSSITGGFNFSGFSEMNIVAGEPYGFTLRGYEDDSTGIMRGTLSLSDTPNPILTPEPSSLLLALTGFAVLAAIVLRRRFADCAAAADCL
jgi:hypothetical protein